MISLKTHNRLRDDSRLPAGHVPLPTLEERAATARRWAEGVQQPRGVRRELRSASTPRPQQSARGTSISSVLDPVIERMGIGDEAELADLREFAAKMLAPRTRA